MKSTPIKSIIIILFLLTLIWVPFLLKKISLVDSIIITISMFIGGLVGSLVLEKGKNKSS